VHRHGGADEGSIGPSKERKGQGFGMLDALRLRKNNLLLRINSRDTEFAARDCLRIAWQRLISVRFRI